MTLLPHRKISSTPTLAWFENLGNGRFGIERQAVAGEGVWAVDAGDLDGDGDLDLVTSMYNQFNLEWSDNTDGGGDFSGQNMLAQPGSLPMDVALADLDNNGQLDVVAVPLVGSGNPVWVPNSGGQETQSIEIPATGATRFAIEDINGDQVPDVVLNSDQGLLWVTAVGTPPRVIGDSNGDGVFNSSDFVTVFVAGFYETGLPATFEQGDWNGDGVFSSSDLVTAFISGGYVNSAQAPRAMPAAITIDNAESSLAERSVVSLDASRLGQYDSVQDFAAAVDWLLQDDRRLTRQR